MKEPQITLQREMLCLAQCSGRCHPTRARGFPRGRDRQGHGRDTWDRGMEESVQVVPKEP